ncbi:RICIN domain-containing protein [Citreicella sp. C3M06]|uniref:RICIN domain-containing protein n=1 Tax=Citreicella sp. C3M06 TaxID=2841564 RepID=UPI001C081CED|nr:RICIN domain-containing protein [Citreicella sp. C3M06]MBU2963432.1 RICIN domain-containing protein [Citreicella sp. C3M06]
MIRHAAPSAAIAALLSAGMAQANTVEVYLVDPLDNLQNGYCVDISGGQGPLADPSAGLQGHTCYSPSGNIFVDQGFGPDRFADGIFYMPEFDVCMQAPSTEPGTALELVSCDGSEAQNFIFSGAGTITPASAPQLCVTVGADTRFGRSEENQIKALTLEPCTDARAAYQIWGNRSAE